METQTLETKFVSVNQAAARLGVHVYTVRRLVWRGILPAIKVGRVLRIPVKALDELEEKAVQRGRVDVMFR
jgi:excisionase family DNA binding protein